MSKKILAALFATVLSLNAFADCGCTEAAADARPVASEEVATSNDEATSNETVNTEIVAAD